MLDLKLDVDFESQSLAAEDLGSSLERIQSSIYEMEDELAC
jgi:hypothetical protein